MKTSILFRWLDVHAVKGGMAALGALLLSATGVAAPADNLAIWLKADAGLEVNDSGQVISWKNQGTSGSVFDMKPGSGEPNAGIVMKASPDLGFNGFPVLDFDATDYLISEGQSDAGLTAAGGTWFLVNNTDTGFQGGVFSLTPNVDTKRLGCWYANSYLRCVFYGDWSRYGGEMPADAGKCQCQCGTSYIDEQGTRVEHLFRQSATSGTPVGTCGAIVPGAAYLQIGKFSTWADIFNGRFAEFRFYNRPLTAPERAAVDFELSSKYGLVFTAYGLVGGTLPAGYTNEVVGAGHGLNKGAPAATVMTAASGGAEFAFVTAPDAEKDALVVLANDGAEGASRKWWLGGDEAARACPVTLSFDAATFAHTENVGLIVKPHNGTRAALAIPPTRENGRLVFALPAGWKSGEYEVADHLAASLAVWLTSDKGVETDDSGVVTKWTNRGTLGSAYDLAPVHNTGGVTVKTDANGFVGRPAVCFDAQDALISGEGSAELFSAAGGAWFIVYQASTGYGPNGGSRGLFGLMTGTPRTGAWIQNGYSFCAFWGSYQNQVDNALVANEGNPYRAHCLCSTSFYEGQTRTERVFAKSALTGTVTGTRSAITPQKIPLSIGDALDWYEPGSYFMGSVAELRFYNAPLTAPERAAIDFELSSKYGLQFFGLDVGGGYIPMGYTHGAVGAGHGLHKGVPAATVMTAASGGAEFAFVTAPDAEQEALVVLANDGAEGASRKWWLGGDAAARACPVTLSFDAATYADVRNLRLMHHATTPTGAWEVEPWRPAAATRREVDGRIVLTLEPGWVSGEYALTSAEDVGLSIWFRADRGLVTDDAGKVVAWKNQGTAGADFDLAVQANAGTGATLSVDPDFGGQQAVVFDGSGWLETAQAADSGMTSLGGTWFVVYQPDTVGNDDNVCFFTFDKATTEYLRWGAFFASGGVRGFWRTDSGVFVQPPRTQGVPQIVSMTASLDPENEDKYLLCGGQNGNEAPAPVKQINRSTGTPGIFSIGSWISWMTPFIGRIAEFRFYNYPLSASERKVVELELAARYGLALHDASAGAVAQFPSHGKEVTPFGTWAQHAVDPIPTSVATVGGLTLAYAEELAEDANSVAVASHDGGAMQFGQWAGSTRFPEALGRTWFVLSSYPSSQMTFTFDTAPDAENYRYVLLYSDGTDGRFRRVKDAACVLGENTVSITATLPGSGTYALARGTAAQGLILIVR